ncbi:MAG: hypothetical protein IPL29_08260 [Propionivibrio sp.]|nr:hypothetical protein [Propionivibrio sp.]
MKPVFKGVFVAVFALCFGSAFAASFDCTKARAEDEKAICQSAELSKLDDELSAEFKVAIEPFKGWKERATPFRKNQSDWVKDRAGCGATEGCLANAYKKRIAWLKQGLHKWSGEWAGKRYSLSVFFDADLNRPLVRIYDSPKLGEKFLIAELQARYVTAANNMQEGTDAVQVTPEFQADYRQYEGVCSAISLNFERDEELYLAGNESCTLFKKEPDRNLSMKKASYHYPATK